MPANFTTSSTFQLFAVAGSLITILCSLITAFAYHGKQGQAYSPLNHFISELGEKGVSRLAWVFNLGLILCGICLIPAVVVLGLLLPGTTLKMGMFFGVICAISLSFVGVYPMNNLKPHGRAAITFFRGGLLMVLTFSSSIAFQKPVATIMSPFYAFAGLPAILAFAYFLYLMHQSSKAERDPLAPMEFNRPRVWKMTISEWAIFVTIVLWFVVIAIGLGN